MSVAVRPTHEVYRFTPSLETTPCWCGACVDHHMGFEVDRESAGPHSDPHCAEHVKHRTECGDIGCECSCHESGDLESALAEGES